MRLDRPLLWVFLFSFFFFFPVDVRIAFQESVRVRGGHTAERFWGSELNVIYDGGNEVGGCRFSWRSSVVTCIIGSHTPDFDI